MYIFPWYSLSIQTVDTLSLLLGHIFHPRIEMFCPNASLPVWKCAGRHWSAVCCRGAYLCCYQIHLLKWISHGSLIWRETFIPPQRCLLGIGCHGVDGLRGGTSFPDGVHFAEVLLYPLSPMVLLHCRVNRVYRLGFVILLMSVVVLASLHSFQSR